MQQSLIISAALAFIGLRAAFGATIKSEVEDVHFWYDKGREELFLAEASAYKKGQREFRRPLNVIVFVGDGMGLTTQTAARVKKGQLKGRSDERQLIWENFPSLGLLKTYCLDFQVPDSASTATALFSGVKTNWETLGFDHKIRRNDISSENEATKLTSIMQWAQNKRMKTGFVTDMRVTHATPAALYAHSAYRKWECDAKMPPPQNHSLSSDFKDIARHLVVYSRGKDLNVIMGGGLASLRDNGLGGVDEWTCLREDGRDLVDVWLNDHKANAHFVQNKRQLDHIDASRTDYLLGVFSQSHIPFKGQRTQDEPSLKDMTLKAIEILSKDNNTGYMLVVESGSIDRAHHKNMASDALLHTLELDETVEATLNAVNLRDTLIIVTSDHSHAMSMSAEPLRGADIEGFGTRKTVSGNLIPILTYAQGPGGDPQLSESLPKDGVYPATNHAYKAFHGGQDVGVFATGPMSFLFHKVHEQSYVGHVIAYAICAGPYQRNCKHKVVPSSVNDDLDRDLTSTAIPFHSNYSNSLVIPMISVAIAILVHHLNLNIH